MSKSSEEIQPRKSKFIVIGVFVVVAVVFLAGYIFTVHFSIQTYHENQNIKAQYKNEKKFNRKQRQQHYTKMISALQPRLDKRFIDIIVNEIIKSSKKYNLRPELIIALIHRESSFNPISVSNKNCIGLMQINPKPHKEKLEKRDISYYQASYVKYNIDIGCEILKKYIKQNNNDVRKALLNYVGGHHKTYVKDILGTYANLTVNNNYTKIKEAKNKTKKLRNKTEQTDETILSFLPFLH